MLGLCKCKEGGGQVKSKWMYRKKLKLFEIFRVVDGKEEVLAIGLNEEQTKRVVELLNEEADDE